MKLGSERHIRSFCLSGSHVQAQDNKHVSSRYVGDGYVNSPDGVANKVSVSDIESGF